MYLSMINFIVAANLFVACAIIHYIYYKYTLFNKTIEISKIYDKKINHNQTKHICDKNGVVYKVGYCLWALDETPERCQFKEGESYNVTGYGLSRPYIGLNYIIIKARRNQLVQ